MSAANLFASMLFGSIGIGVFIYGKKQASAKPMVIGILLMVYPYFISNAIALFAIGILLIASLWII